jgi:hypothetical protein
MKAKHPLSMEPNYQKKCYLNNYKGKIWCDGYLKFVIANTGTYRILNMKCFKDMFSSFKFDSDCIMGH